MSLLKSQAPASVERYLQLRERSRELHNAIIGTIDSKLMEECAKRLGLMRRGTFVFENEEEMAVWMDYCVYDHLRAGRNAVQRYFALHPPQPGTDDELMAAAMCQAVYRLLSIEGVWRGVGVEVLDVATQEAFLVTDIGLSRTAQRGFLMATRILHVGNIWMTTGAGIPLQPETMLQLMAEAGRFEARLERFKTRPGRESDVDFSTWLIRACLRTQATQCVNYEDIEHAAYGEHYEMRMPNPRLSAAQDLDPLLDNPYLPAAPMTRAGAGMVAPASRSAMTPPVVQGVGAAARTGRNEPCPCGSGRKYKKCCGHG